MTTVSLVLAVALFLLVHACLKWGFITAIKWAALIGLEFPVFWFSGWMAGNFLEKAGVKALPMRTWLIICIVIALVAWQIAKRTGWATVLRGMFVAATLFSAIVMLLFLFLMMGVVIHATPQAMLFIAVASIVIAGIGRGSQARGQ
jgi:hypothetical protein